MEVLPSSQWNHCAVSGNISPFGANTISPAEPKVKGISSKILLGDQSYENDTFISSI
jgi:hypothetical protein